MAESLFTDEPAPESLFTDEPHPEEKKSLARRGYEAVKSVAGALAEPIRHPIDFAEKNALTLAGAGAGAAAAAPYGAPGGPIGMAVAGAVGAGMGGFAGSVAQSAAEKAGNVLGAGNPPESAGQAISRANEAGV